MIIYHNFWATADGTYAVKVTEHGGLFTVNTLKNEEVTASFLRQTREAAMFTAVLAWRKLSSYVERTLASTGTFEVYLTNFGYSLPETYGHVDSAVERATRTGFECTILRNGLAVATWSPISGRRAI